MVTHVHIKFRPNRAQIVVSMRNYYENTFRFLTFGNDRISQVRNAKSVLDTLDTSRHLLDTSRKYLISNDYFVKGVWGV